MDRGEHLNELAVIPKSWPGAVLAAILAAACTLLPAPPETPPPATTPTPEAPASPPPEQPPHPAATPEAPPPATKPAQREPPPADSQPALLPAVWSELPRWAAEDPTPALGAFLIGCRALVAREAWKAACAQAAAMTRRDPRTVRSFFETHFQPYRAVNADGSAEGLITGYYEPLLRGSRRPTSRYRYPLHGVPSDLLVVELAELYPELKGLRLRGRLDGRRIVPYFSREQIDRGDAGLENTILYWVDDPIDLFFLQIQGSGQLKLDSGETVRIGYADQNGHPYRSIGRALIDRGELTLERASMQGIKAWARQNPDKLVELLNHNASYVFFRELPAGLAGPIGSLGVPLSAGRSLAVDVRYVPLGAPVFLATTWPNTSRPLHRLMVAQDTGGAIRGGVRGDFFWGFGEDAGAQAGRMRQSGKMWVLLPKGVAPAQALGR